MKKKSKKLYKPLHIIIDSSDGLGKSTVCKLLSKKLKIPIIKMTGMPKYFKKNPEEASQIYNETVIQFKDFSFIQDRGWSTSIVYTIVYDRDRKDLQYLNDVIGKLDEKVFILTGTKPYRKDKLVSSKKWKEINDIYKNIDTDECKRLGVNIEIIKIDDLTPEEVCNQILKSL